MVALGNATTTPERILGFIAVLLGTANAVGGYAVTERMLEMFKSSKDRDAKKSGAADKAGGDAG
jgi:NAD(P) transhydrogenase subunit alpha